MTEVLTASQYLAEVGKPKEQSESEKVARAFEWQMRARRLPAPRWKFGPGGEVKFAAEHVDIPRQGKRRHVSAKPKAPQWRFDFAWPDLLIACEVEGIVVFRDKESGRMVSRGRHTTPEGFNDDCEKYAWAAVLGWRVVRFTPKQVKSGFAVDMLVRLFAAVDVQHEGKPLSNADYSRILARMTLASAERPTLDPSSALGQVQQLFDPDKPPF